MTPEQFHKLVIKLKESAPWQNFEPWITKFDQMEKFSAPTVNIHKELLIRFRWEHASLLAFAAAVMDCGMDEVSPLKIQEHLCKLAAEAEKKDEARRRREMLELLSNEDDGGTT